MRGIILAVAVLSAITMAACGSDIADVNSGQLAINVPPSPGLGVVAFKIEVWQSACPEVGGTSAPATVASACSSLSLELEPLPSGLPAPAPQGSNDRFTDHYFTLLAGTYCVRATPMTDINCTSPAPEDCTVPEKVVTVYKSQTTEIVLVSNCMRDDTGGLDVVAVLNNDPVITSLAYSPSKFFCEGTQLTVAVAVDEPDNDPLSWTWRLKNGTAWDPMPATSCSQSADGTNPGVLTCSGGSFTAGNYQAYVKACDPGNLCALLYFPFHVTAAGVGPCPPLHQ